MKSNFSNIIAALSLAASLQNAAYAAGPMQPSAGVGGRLNSTCRPYMMVENKTAGQAPGAAGAESFFWRISKPGVPDSYLLGTFHSTNPKIQENWEALPILLARLKTFVSETDVTDPAAAAEFSRLMLASDGAQSLDTALDDKVNQEIYQQGLRTLAAYGLSTSGANSLKPWRAFLILARSPVATPSLDQLLAAEARAAKLEMVALQSPAEAVASIERLTLQEQVEILKETICDYKSVQEQSARLQNFYAKDDIKGFTVEANRLASPQPGLVEKLGATLVEQRNTLFLPRLKPILEKGGAFIAVEASHLFGSSGLVEDLRAQGFTLAPLVRTTLIADLISQTSRRPPTVEALLQWLRTSTLQIPNGYLSPSIAFVPSSELENMGCEETCALAMRNGTIFISVAKYAEVLSGDAKFMSSILELMVKEIQELNDPDRSCGAWQVRRVQSAVLQAQYLSSRGMYGVRVKKVAPADCVP